MLAVESSIVVILTWDYSTNPSDPSHQYQTTLFSAVFLQLSPVSLPISRKQKLYPAPSWKVTNVPSGGAFLYDQAFLYDPVCIGKTKCAEPTSITRKNWLLFFFINLKIWTVWPLRHLTCSLSLFQTESIWLNINIYLKTTLVRSYL